MTRFVTMVGPLVAVLLFGVSVGHGQDQDNKSLVIGNFETNGFWGGRMTRIEDRTTKEGLIMRSGGWCHLSQTGTDATSGDYAGRFYLSLKKNGPAASMIRWLRFPVQAHSLSFNIRTTDVKNIICQLKDTAGALFSTNVSISANGQWQRVDIPFRDIEAAKGREAFKQRLQHVRLIVSEADLATDALDGSFDIDEVILHTTDEEIQRIRKLTGALSWPEVKLSCGGVSADVRVEVGGAVYDGACVVATLTSTPAGSQMGSVSGHLSVEAVSRAPWDRNDFGFWKTQRSFTVGPRGSTSIVFGPAPVPANPHNDYPQRITLQIGNNSAVRVVTARLNGSKIPPPLKSYHSKEIPSSPFGVGVHLSANLNREELEMAADAGMKWIRTDFLQRHMEIEPGKYSVPPHYDEFVNLAGALGLNVLCLVNSRGSTRYSSLEECQEGVVEFSRFLAKHFGDRITHYEILNEPIADLPGYWQTYHKIANACASAIKEIQPDAVVFPNPSYPHDAFVFIPKLFKDVDGISLHPYSHGGIPERPAVTGDEPFASSDGTFADLITAVRVWLDKSNCGKGIFLTEFGYTSFHQPSTLGAPYRAVTEEAKAAYVIRQAIEAYGLNLEMILPYESFRRVGPRSHQNNFGLLDSNLNPAVTYSAYKRVISLAAFAKPFEPDFPVRKVFDQRFVEEIRDIRRDYLKRLAKLKKNPNLSDEQAWSRMLSPARVKDYWCRDTRNGNLVLFLWHSLPVTEDSAILGKLHLRTADYEGPIAVDLLSGQYWDVAWRSIDGEMVLEDVPLGAKPVAIIFYRK